MKKRVLLSAASTVLLVSVLAACGSTAEQTPETDNTVKESVTAQEETEKTDLYQQLRGLDFGGAEVPMLLRDEYVYEFISEKENGDLVNDAVFARARAVEEMLNVKLQYRSAPGNVKQKVEFTGLYRNSILAADDSYSLVASAANYMLPLTAEGLFANLTETENVHTDSPWYPKGYIDNMSIEGKLFLTATSASVNLVENMCVLFFNKNLTEALGFEEPYALVREGKWTLEKLEEMVQNCYQDLNGNSKADTEDRIGYLTYSNMVNAQAYGMGLSYFDHDETGMLHYKTSLTEHDINVYNRLRDFLNTAGEVYNYDNPKGTALAAAEEMVVFWESGNTLFMPQVLSCAQQMRGTGFDYGILPMPKYDEAQKTYMSYVLENVTVMGISPITDTARAGAVLEALSIGGYEDIAPAYFDIALKDKYARDADTAEMLDIIRSSIVFKYPMMQGFVPLNVFSKTDPVSAYLEQAAQTENTFNTLVEGWKSLE